MAADYMSIRKALQDVLTPKSLIAGVGNSMRGDDGFGPAVVEALKGSGVTCIDCGVAPENYLEKIVAAAPDTVLFIDAMDLGGQAGDVQLFGADELSQDGGLSTHALPIKMVCEYVRARRAEANIFMLGMQPESIAFGTGIGPAAAVRARECADIIAEVIAHA